MLRALILLALATIALTSCGTPGAPQPPSLWLPKPPDDLSAGRKGNKVTLSWTMPRETTDAETLKPSRLGPTKICRGLGDSLAACAETTNVPPHIGTVVGQLPPDKTPIPQQERGAPKLSFTDTISAEVQRRHETDFATYAVQLFNSNGKAAGLSNQVRVPLAPAFEAPQEITATVTRSEVQLVWSDKQALSSADRTNGIQRDRRVIRRDTAQPPNVAVVSCTAADSQPNSVGGAADSCADRSFAWETTYFYHVTPITRVMKDGKVIAEVEGDDSPEVKVYTKDIYPPAAPTGVQAVFSGTGQKPFIDIAWTPNTDEDLAGYNVYRHEHGAAPQKINDKLIPSPSFRDDNVGAGHTYVYSVTAVDLRNNESPRSEDTSETVPNK
jgi:hypothetical protein